MEVKVKQWVLLSALFAAIRLESLLWLFESKIGNIFFVLENLVFMVILGVTVLGFRRYSWRNLLFTIVISIAGTIAEGMLYRFSGVDIFRLTYILDYFDRASYALNEMWNLAGMLMVIVAMSMILYGRCLKLQTRSRTFGIREWFLCIVLLILITGVTVWLKLCIGICYQNRAAQMPEDPLMRIAFLMTAYNNGVTEWMNDAYLGGRRLLKALCVWVVAGGVLGFYQTEG